MSTKKKTEKKTDAQVVADILKAIDAKLGALFEIQKIRGEHELGQNIILRGGKK